MDEHVQNLEAAEKAALGVLGQQLAGHLGVAGGTFNLVNVILGRAPEVPVRQVSPARAVATALLLRLAGDLRCVAFLAPRGYPLQAVTLVASMYEAAYTMGAIGTDNDTAQRWLDHDYPTRPFFSNIQSLTLDVLNKMGHANPEEQVRLEYQVYRQLCMGKHANPLLQQQHGFLRLENALAAVVGPTTGEEAERAGSFALEHGTRFAQMGADSFLRHHVPADRRGNLPETLVGLGRQRLHLHEQAMARGWDKDPTPGRWRLE